MSWDNIKQNPLSNLNISPLEIIPYKSRKYRAILDLSFVLKVVGWDLPLVIKETKETAPYEALDQVGTVIPRIIKTFSTSLLSGPNLLQ